MTFTLGFDPGVRNVHNEGEDLPSLHVIQAPDGTGFFETGTALVPIDEVVTLLNKAWDLAEASVRKEIGTAIFQKPGANSCLGHPSGY